MFYSQPVTSVWELGLFLCELDGWMFVLRAIFLKQKKHKHDSFKTNVERKSVSETSLE